MDMDEEPIVEGDLSGTMRDADRARGNPASRPPNRSSGIDGTSPRGRSVPGATRAANVECTDAPRTRPPIPCGAAAS